MNKFDKFLKIFYTFINIFFILSLIDLDIVPSKYIFSLAFVLIVFNLLLIIRTKKTGSKMLIFKQVLSVIVSLLLIVGIVSMNYYYNATTNFFEQINKNNYNVYVYRLYVSSDSGYTDVFSIDDELIGYVNHQSDQITDVFSQIEDDINFKKLEFDTSYEMILGLDESISAFIISDNQYELLEENEPEILENLVLVKEYSVSVENNEITSSKDVTMEPFLIYITGFDKAGNISLTGRSDVNMLAAVNPSTKDISLVSIPRDYYVVMPGYGTLPDKLTHAGVYGLDVSISTIENLLDVEIDKYIKINFTTVINLVDEIGPLSVDSKYSFCSWTYCYKKGINVLNGAEALEFSRERYRLPQGDIDRAFNQQLVINAIINKAATPEILVNYTSILNSLQNYFATNFSDSDIKSLVKMQLSDMANWNVSNYVINGFGSTQYTYSYPHQGLSVLLHDADSIEEAKKIINDTLSDVN